VNLAASSTEKTMIIWEWSFSKLKQHSMSCNTTFQHWFQGEGGFLPTLLVGKGLPESWGWAHARVPLLRFHCTFYEIVQILCQLSKHLYVVCFEGVHTLLFSDLDIMIFHVLLNIPSYIQQFHGYIFHSNFMDLEGHKYHSYDFLWSAFN
jgi:hypothetical protein